MLSSRYNEALKQPEYSDVDPLLARQFIEFFHKFENSIEASDNWYDTSAKSFCQYWICEGDHLLNWKDKGYRTVLDLLQVRMKHLLVFIDFTHQSIFSNVAQIIFEREAPSD